MLAALFVLSLVGIAAFLGLRVFTLAHVEVEGCVLRDPDEVRALSGLLIGDSVFMINNARVREGVESSPYYILDKTSIQLPDTIYIAVTERQPRAIINYLGANIVMDETGSILDMRQEVGNVRCPIVTGMQVSSFRVGEVVESSDPEQVEAMNAVLTELVRQDCINTVSQIDVLDTLDLRMMLMDGVTVRLGTLNLMESKIQWMRAAIAGINLHALGRGEVDVSSGKMATFLTEGAAAAVTVPADAPEALSEEPEDGEDGGADDMGGEGENEDENEDDPGALAP